MSRRVITVRCPPTGSRWRPQLIIYFTAIFSISPFIWKSTAILLTASLRRINSPVHVGSEIIFPRLLGHAWQRRASYVENPEPSDWQTAGPGRGDSEMGIWFSVWKRDPVGFDSNKVGVCEFNLFPFVFLQFLALWKVGFWWNSGGFGRD